MALVVLAAAAALVLGATGPASAADGLVVTIDSPGASQVLTGSTALVKGTATTGGLYQMSGVSVRVTSATNPESFGCDGNCDGGSDAHTASFSFSPRLDFNGAYTATVTAFDRLTLVGGGERSTVATRSFHVEVDPAPPQDVKVDVGADRRVTISWARNTERDLKGYQVTRLAPGSSSGTVVANVGQGPPGSRVSAVDADVPAAGGSYRYVVTAVRPDRDGKVSDRATSQSQPRSVEVGAAPTDAGGSPGTGGAGPGAGPGAAPSSTAAGGPRGALDVSSFLSRTGGAPPSLAVPGGVALPVDNGFSELPFAVPGGDIDDESDSTDPAVLGTTESASNERALFVPIAAGLLLCVLAFHLRQFNRTVLAAPAAYHPILDSDDVDEHSDNDNDNDNDDAAAADTGDDDDPGSRTAVLVGAGRPRREA